MPQWNALDYGSYTITDTANELLDFADAGSPSTLPKGTRSFVGTLETASVRFRDDGSSPTSTEGTLIDIGARIGLSRSEIGKGQLVRTAGTSAVLKGHFYDVDAQLVMGGSAV
jgi:hypothetical protein